jgi:7SK snRNA methylphosphate capping enzyme
MCLSTIKWIHLNYGDVGVKALFLKAYEQLTDGGYFIFDEQPWKAYKKTKHHQANFKACVLGDGIVMRPDKFAEYLKYIGFKHVTKLVYDKNEKPINIYKK